MSAFDELPWVGAQNEQGSEFKQEADRLTALVANMAEESCEFCEMGYGKLYANATTHKDGDPYPGSRWFVCADCYNRNMAESARLFAALREIYALTCETGTHPSPVVAHHAAIALGLKR